MLLESTPINQAQIKNTGAVQEFAIKNSAKAFSILSSGLYANKIRAIVRELSCNAYDSHVAAGKADIPFEIHLPNSLEPWFSVKDFGTGLSVQEVQNIYSTYFESTKTNSNDYIGALGLGSKSPFSYTDNFSVTAIKNGIAGLFSCIINDNGIPSTVLMSTYNTTEPNGVEVKFSVNQRQDFDKFKNEAQDVLMYFPVKPKVQCYSSFQVKEQTYIEKDIVDSVSIIQGYNNIAVMGNIGYNIDGDILFKHIPDVAEILSTGTRLEIRFEIGELDIQASREGLSYIPSTIEAFRIKLKEINDSLIGIVKDEFKEITNTWEKIQYIREKKKINLYNSAVKDLIKSEILLSNFFNTNGDFNYLKLYTDDTKTKRNIIVQAFSCNYKGIVKEVAPSLDYDRYALPPASSYRHYFNVDTNQNTLFVYSTKKRGIISRIKYNLKTKYSGKTIYLLTPADETKGIHLDDFYKDVYNPPASNIIKESDLEVEPKKAKVSFDYEPVTILKFDRYNDKWQKGGLSSDYSDNCTYYYIPLKNTTPDENLVFNNTLTFADLLVESLIPELKFTLYGVRRSDIDNIKSKKNWVNAEDYTKEVLRKLDKNSVSKTACDNSGIENWRQIYYNLNQFNIKGSELEQEIKHLKFKHKKAFSIVKVQSLLDSFGIVNKNILNYEKKYNKYLTINEKLHILYPLLRNYHRILNKDDADYVKAIDLYRKVQLSTNKGE